MFFSEESKERVARAICNACEEDPDYKGDCRGNEFRWQDYLPVANAAIDAVMAELPSNRDYKGTNSEQHMNRTDGRTDGRTEQEPCRPATEFRDLQLFAPGPNDERWAEIVAERADLAPATESAVRGLADGLAAGMDEHRADRLRCGGNGVVALQAAVAFVGLARRAGIA